MPPRALRAALATLAVSVATLAVAQVNTVTFGVIAVPDRLAAEATYHTPGFELFGVAAGGLVSAQARVEDLFTAAPTFGGSAQAGLGLQGCHPGYCWSFDVRYRLLATVGEPITGQPSATFVVSIGLDTAEGGSQVPTPRPEAAPP